MGDQIIEVQPGFSLVLFDSAGDALSFDRSVGIAYLKYPNGPWLQIMFHAEDEEAYLAVIRQSQMHRLSCHTRIFKVLNSALPKLIGKDVRVARVEFTARDALDIPKCVIDDTFNVTGQSCHE
ncbi:MAG TPA: hypothetical protein VN081_05140 [Dongiaceae bacterium]|nr:hypothetical protein [Dongiaceae bacterium]